MTENVPARCPVSGQTTNPAASFAKKSALSTQTHRQPFTLQRFWVKKCMKYEVEGARPKGRTKKTWTEMVEKDCKARGLNREDAMDRKRWRKQIRDD